MGGVVVIDGNKLFREAVDGPPPPEDTDDDDGDYGHDCSHTFMLLVASNTVAANGGGTYLLGWVAFSTLFTVWTALSWLFELMASFGWQNGAREAFAGFLWFFLGWAVAILAASACQKWRRGRVA